MRRENIYTTYLLDLMNVLMSSGLMRALIYLRLKDQSHLLLLRYSSSPPSGYLILDKYWFASPVHTNLPFITNNAVIISKQSFTDVTKNKVRK